MNEFESARGDFEKVLEVNPQNKAARLQISMCQRKAKEHNERDRRVYANMFKKFAEQDAKVRGPHAARDQGWEAEAEVGRSLNWRPAWSTELVPGYTEKPSLNKTVATTTTTTKTLSPSVLFL